jgi:hypothetical protein
MVLPTLVGEGFEECATSRPRFAKNDLKNKVFMEYMG